MARTIWLEPIRRSKNHLSLVYGIDGLRFETAYWYDDVDFFALESRFGAEFMERIYFHILMFEVNKLVSLRPALFDLGRYERFYTPQFEQVWRTVVRKVWAQWRYQNDMPDYAGPAFDAQHHAEAPQPVQLSPGDVSTIAFCGGGKDSLVALKLLERGGVPFASFGYSNSVYGRAEMQHQLIERLLTHSVPARHHKQWINDSALAAPADALTTEYGVSEILAAETPSSVFAILPIALQYGYANIVLAHERSANVGNLVWDRTGEDVNHQWGKSFAAEQLINDYIRRELVQNFTYCSVLQPIYDVVILSQLRKDADSVQDTHSCNVAKPWCGKCPKCAYVWLNYLAYLPREAVPRAITPDVFDVEENQLWFRQMLGLEQHTPFECIGQIDESRLAFELCKQKGYAGRAMSMYSAEITDLDVPAIVEKYTNVDERHHGMPEAIAQRVLPQLRDAADDSRRYIEAVLG